MGEDSTTFDQNTQEAVYEADDPIWIDEVWVDTVVVVGLTAFILCLMGLSKVCIPNALALPTRSDSRF